MTGGEIAAIIAAIAFAALAGALIYVLIKVANVVSELHTTVDQANETLTTLTKNADHLLIEVEGLLNKSNVTLDDVNGKIGMLDPVFRAVGDLGITVQDLNRSSRKLTNTLGSFTSRTKKK